MNHNFHHFIFLIMICFNSKVFTIDIDLFSISYDNGNLNIGVLEQTVYDSEQAKAKAIADEFEIKKCQAESKKNAELIKEIEEDIQKTKKEKEIIKRRLALKLDTLKTSINNNLS